MANKLFNRQFLLTRPLHQAKPLFDLIQKEAGIPILFPTLEIIYLNDTSYLSSLFEKMEKVSYALFLSANAISSIVLSKNHSHWLNKLKQFSLIAIGEGTRKALLAHDLIPEILSTVDSSSEGLLALPELQQVHQKKIAIFKGEGGRNILPTTLKERGANVIEANVYRRQSPAQQIDQQWINQQLKKMDAIIITSGESLENLFKLIPNNALLPTLTFIFVSQRIAKMAESFSIKKYLIAKNASDKAIFDILIQYFGK
ncbi:MAG: Uroporphyrinogen-III synthase [Legionellaceae bacterium]